MLLIHLIDIPVPQSINIILNNCEKISTAEVL